MRLPFRPYCLFLLCLAALLDLQAWGQQVTYYDFDSPQANPSQYSYSCSPGSASNPLFCFNDATGNASSPFFLNDFYPANIDPTQSGGSYQYATQLEPSQAYQGSSMWFSVPQKVANGFTSWFAFRITPSSSSPFTADGLAFVIQNAAGGAAADPTTGCVEQGSGPTVVGTRGGCMGYGGIDNSFALEFDTYLNAWDPYDISNSFDDNHVAIQSCGTGVNTPDHTGSCLVTLANGTGPGTPALISNPQNTTTTPSTTITLADGNVHQVVVIYNGPNEANPNLLQIFLDPQFVAGTHTPVAGSIPILSGTYNLAGSLSLINSGSANDSAYVGFTSATGESFEEHELMAWTYTPHSTVVQEQPLNPPGTITLFPFGAHVYGVNYPQGGPSTSNVTMRVAANTVPPALFASLITGTPFQGSQCQVYEETGGNCIIYSISCLDTTSGQPEVCPSTLNTADFIATKSSYNNLLQPASPGFLQGDPFYSAISSITGDGQTATVTCSGECSVTQGQTVTILGNSLFSGTVTAQAPDPSTPNVFTFASTVSGTGTGGYLTSGNLQNIFVSYSPQNLDGSSSGKTKNFSDLVVTSVTNSAGSQIQLTAASDSPTEGTADLLTATVTGQAGQLAPPGGTVTFSAGSTVICTSSLTAGTATCSYTPMTTGNVNVTAEYQGDTYHLLGNSNTLTLNVIPPYDSAIHLQLGGTVLDYPGITTVTVCIAPATRATPTGWVKLYDGSNLIATLPLLWNGCAYWLTLPGLSLGTHSASASYSGDAHNPAGVSAPVTVTVNPAPVLMVSLCGKSVFAYGGNYTCTVSLISTAGPAKGVLSYELDGGTAISVPINALGVAQFTIADPGVGTHHVVLSYARQTNYAAAGPQTETFTVKPD